MTIKELERRVADLEVELRTLKALAETAIGKSIDAMAEVRGMQQSSHKVQFIDPNKFSEGDLFERGEQMSDALVGDADDELLWDMSEEELTNE